MGMPMICNNLLKVNITNKGCLTSWKHHTLIWSWCHLTLVFFFFHLTNYWMKSH
jgi:hypothetical protein